MALSWDWTMSKTLRYKDMNCSPNTALYKALEEKDMKLAEKLYKEYNALFHQQFPKELWDKIKG